MDYLLGILSNLIILSIESLDSLDVYEVSLLAVCPRIDFVTYISDCNYDMCFYFSAYNSINICFSYSAYFNNIIKYLFQLLDIILETLRLDQ